MNLKTIELPETLTHIGDYAFNRCNKLETIFIDADDDNFFRIKTILLLGIGAGPHEDCEIIQVLPEKSCKSAKH